MKNPMKPTKIIREKIIIYLDLSSKVIAKKNMLKNIELFVKAKFELNPHHDFSIFYFKEGGEPKIHDGLTTTKSIKKVIEYAYKERTHSANYFENGLFFCLSGIASSFLAQAITFRIVVFSDLPSEKNSQYMEALMNLVETVRTFPTFIDIIRIGNERLYSDDVKLRIITTLTNGGLFYVDSAKSLKDALACLVHNKVLPDLRPEGGQAISKQHELYYSDLSLKLSLPPLHQKGQLKCHLCEDNLCQYCNDENDILKTCPSCGIGLHECCSSLYSWNYNIGLKNIFRCPGCGSLIKLNEKIVYRVNGTKLLDEEESKMEENLDEAIDSEDVWSPKSKPDIEESQKLEENITQRADSMQREGQEIDNTKTETRMGLFGPRPGISREPSTNSPIEGNQETPSPIKKPQVKRVQS